MLSATGKALAKSEVCFCESCIDGKGTQRPLDKSKKLNNYEPLEFLHMDTVSMEVVSRDRKRGFLLITDKRTSFRSIFCYSNGNQVKHEVVAILKCLQRVSKKMSEGSGLITVVNLTMKS